VNRDGWLDVIRFDFPGRAAYWYENPQGRGGMWTERVVHPAVASESPQMEDVNGDGATICCSSMRGRGRWCGCKRR
jgi:hypothetical protein